MGDVIVRALVVVAIALAALAAARVAGRVQQPFHRLLDLRATDLPSGVILFTSVDCTNCAAARAAYTKAGIEFREVTWELEGGLMETVGVDAVPLAVFRTADGVTAAQIAGVPRVRALRRAIGLLPV